jgi:hypothetical protein
MVKPNKRTSNYPAKRRAGLCGMAYDVSSRSFREGAHKHWSGNLSRDRSLALIDRQQLASRETRYHQFVRP